MKLLRFALGWRGQVLPHGTPWLFGIDGAAGSTSGGNAGSPPNSDSSAGAGGSGSSGGGSNGGADGDRSATGGGLSQAEVAAIAQRRHREIVTAELGRVRKGGLELPREAGLKDLADLTIKQAQELADLRAQLGDGGGDGGDGSGSESKDKGKPSGEKTFTQAEVNRLIKSKLDEAARGWASKENELTGKLSAQEERSNAFIVHQELRRVAAEKGLVPQGVIDHVYSPFGDFPYKLVPGETPGKFKVLDKADATEAINVKTREVYTLGDLLDDLKARKDLGHLVTGKVAGGSGGGGGSTSGADGGRANAGQQGGQPKTARDFINSGLQKGQLRQSSELPGQ